MDDETREAFIAHVRKLQSLAVECPDEDRRLDAVRSLGVMVLLIGETEPPNPGDTQDNVILIADYLKAA